MMTYRCWAQSYFVIDTTKIKCSYDFIEACDTLKGETRKDFLYLEIGSKYSKCYSYNTFRFDSLMSTPEGTKKLIREMILFGKSVRNKEEHDMRRYWQNSHPYSRLTTCVYKNYLEEKLTVTDRIVGDDYLYEDSICMQWILSEDSTKNILGYECQQASCKFRGREWTAWFATDIPVSDGPWKFCGLPGLIMEVYDKEAQEHFYINGIEQTEAKAIYYGTIGKDINRFERITFSKFLKAMYNELRGNDVSDPQLEQIGIQTSGKKYIPKFDWLEREEDK